MKTQRVGRPWDVEGALGLTLLFIPQTTLDAFYNWMTLLIECDAIFMPFRMTNVMLHVYLELATSWTRQYYLKDM